MSRDDEREADEVYGREDRADLLGIDDPTWHMPDSDDPFEQAYADGWNACIHALRNRT